MSKLLIPNDYPIIASPQLIKLCGMAGAAFIQKLHYCLNDTKVKKHQHQKKTWWKHSLENWLAALGVFSVATIKRAIARLKKLGLIEVSQLANNPWDRTNYYTINYSKIKALFANKQAGKTNAPGKSEPDAPPQQPPKNLSGTVCATVPSATTEQLQAMPMDKRKFYQQLRFQKLDIGHDDLRIAGWMAKGAAVLHHIVWARKQSSTPYGWHTPEQLLLAAPAGRAVA